MLGTNDTFGLSLEKYHFHYILAMPSSIITHAFLTNAFDEYRQARHGSRQLFDMAKYYEQYANGLCRRFSERLLREWVWPLWEKAYASGEVMSDTELSHMVHLPEDFLGGVVIPSGQNPGPAYNSLLRRLTKRFLELNKTKMKKSAFGNALRARFEYNLGRYEASFVASSRAIGKWLDKGSSRICAEPVLSRALAEELIASLEAVRLGE